MRTALQVRCSKVVRFIVALEEFQSRAPKRVLFKDSSTIKYNPNICKPVLNRGREPVHRLRYCLLTTTYGEQDHALAFQLFHVHNQFPPDFRLPERSCTRLIFLHVDNAPNAITSLHVAKSLVDIGQRLAMRDELVDLELVVHIVVNEIRELSAALDTAEGAALPHAAGDELEC